MSSLARILSVLSVAGIALVSTGCQSLPSAMQPSTWWHYMQPHQWSKLNRWEGPSEYAWYSIPPTATNAPHGMTRKPSFVRMGESR